MESKQTSNAEQSPGSLERAGYAAALGYATRLATGMWERDWKKESPHWQPCDDLLGVLTQIDNMLAGMEKKKRHNAEAKRQPTGGGREAQRKETND